MFIEKNGKKLRTGYTTGSCAAAASMAAAYSIMEQRPLNSVLLKTPAGISLTIETKIINLTAVSAECLVIKDSGDDPDVTDGIAIHSNVELTAGGIYIDGGSGIGRITKPGLKRSIGEAAINPIPMKMIEAALLSAADKYGYNGGFKAIISAKNGEEIAKRTFNSRLGIIGGISILGTTGIVEPMSERAISETIKLEIDVKYCEGIKILLLCPGNYGREFAAENGIDINKAVKCSNYIGEALDYSIYKGYKKILLIGHAGKLIKLAAGIMNTHSSAADGRQEIIAAHAALNGAGQKTIEKIMQSSTVEECLLSIPEADLRSKTLVSISKAIENRLAQRYADNVQIEFIIFSANHIISSPNAASFIRQLTYNI